MRSGPNAPAILDALGDPMRRVIFARLQRAPTHVTALAQGLPITRSAVSRHLKVLTDAGLTRSHRAGARAIYCATPEWLGPLSDWIDAARGAGEPKAPDA
jgi:DNA-binding transcriptional ArsR family regulator